MPRHMLYSGEMDSIISKHFKHKSGWIKDTVPFGPVELGLTVTYFFNQAKNAVVITSPLAVKKNVHNGDAIEPTYQEIITRISHKKGCNTFSVSATFLGKGSSERHYVAFYQHNGNKIYIFDSKISDPHRFLNSSNQPTFLEKIWGILISPFKSIALLLGFGKIVNANFMGYPVQIHRLGTQPIFDGVSCGYHSAGAVLAMADTIDNNETINPDMLITSVLSRDDLSAIAEIILTHSTIPNVSPGLSVMIKKKPTHVINDSTELPKSTKDMNFQHDDLEEDTYNQVARMY